MRTLAPDCTVAVREALDAFVAELRSQGYTENAVRIHERNIDRFLRWTEGSFVPEGPRGR